MSELVKVRCAAASLDRSGRATARRAAARRAARARRPTRRFRRPADPIQWFAEYLTTNNPNAPPPSKRQKTSA